MALPKLNTITYDLTRPSNGETLQYRPFLVKEQKALMIAQESGDDKQIEKAFAQIINDCVINDVDPYTMPMFDIEYIFLRIRGKSVGEKVKLNLLCPDDGETRVDVEINLEEVDVQISVEHSNTIELSDDISLVMKYPCLKDMTGFDETGEVTNLFEMISRCVSEVRQGETVFNRVDMTDKELDDFIDSMSSKHFDEVTNFFTTMPKLVHVVDVKNPNTNKTTEIPIEGLQSFFE